MSLAAIARRLASMGGGGAVRLRKDGPIAHLTLDHPARRNALERWDDGAALLLSGAGGAFCAGLDLSAAELRSAEGGAMMSALMADTLHRLRQLPLLSVAAVDGAAVGGGAELATAADWRVMAAAGSLHFVHAARGAAPGWGGGARLVELLGRAGALRLLALGRRLDAPAAAALGLCDGIAAEGETAAAAAVRLLLAPALAHAASVDALRAIKRGVAGASEISPEVRANEAAALALVWGSEANRRMLAAAGKPKGGQGSPPS
ncbi:hypothetical protein AB1Y20_022571 [Prymnesium parvum]|uniref:3-hydroxyisobutyryl-coenzyme A hydrolase n=1 Tax=Prymnesium parvum TaxID=97485 RepID=A0AB34JHL3_PRYPA